MNYGFIQQFDGIAQLITMCGWLVVSIQVFSLIVSLMFLDDLYYMIAVQVHPCILAPLS